MPIFHRIHFLCSKRPKKKRLSVSSLHKQIPSSGIEIGKKSTQDIRAGCPSSSFLLVGGISLVIYCPIFCIIIFFCHGCPIFCIIICFCHGFVEVGICLVYSNVWWLAQRPKNTELEDVLKLQQTEKHRSMKLLYIDEKYGTTISSEMRN